MKNWKANNLKNKTETNSSNILVEILECIIIIRKIPMGNAKCNTIGK